MIVYIDNNEDMTGQVLLRADGVLYERKGFFGRWNKEFILKRPKDAETWLISVSVESWWRSKIRIVDGQTHILLVEKKSSPAYMEGFPRRFPSFCGTRSVMMFVPLWRPLCRSFSAAGELIIRVLVLPGHNECCTRPILQRIHDKLGSWTRVNLMFQYRPEYGGRGIGTEAAGALISFGFRELGLHRLIAKCDPMNVASWRVMEKNGMRREGRLRENVKIRGEWRDSLLYSILEHKYSG